MSVQNKCQLIVYPDAIGGNISSLNRALAEYFSGLLGGVHLLPFFPSSGDRGFAPKTYDEVDPDFGSWDDVEWIASRWDLMVDLMFNHISRRSEYYQDFLDKKDESPWADLFIKYSEFWPEGRPTQEDLDLIYTRKPRPPYIEEEFGDGSKEKIWCTFDTEQIDLNIYKEKTKEFLRGFLRRLIERGAKAVRLDAFAYATKKPGTTCFFLEPDVWDFLRLADEVIRPAGGVLLPEVHEHYTMQKRIAEHGYYVYDFALPMLFLQAHYDGSARNLKHWLSVCPRHQFTTLDTHDGIGVVDVYDLMTEEEMERTKENVYSRGANVKRIYNTAKYQNLDVYQINCTYYSALGEVDAAYLLARAVQFFTPGIPQVYYVGLLAGRNDIELLEETKVGRNINRHNYSLEEVAREVKRPVVGKLFELMKFRNREEAFDGTYEVLPSPEHQLRIRWSNARAAGSVGEGEGSRPRGRTAELIADFAKTAFIIKAGALGGELETVFQEGA
ncbi:MAG: sucrose phosphorylase [Spirochaetaceae bacterium]